jgi:Ca-activated chloride channel family protein
MMDFAQPYALFLALAAIPVALFAWRPRREGVPIASGMGLRGLKPAWRVRLLPLLPVLRIATIVLLAVAAAGPRVGDANAIVPAEGIDIALAIDTSSSMKESMGEGQTRLSATKDVVREFISGLENDRVGVVVFSEISLALAPPTLDYRALDEIVEGIESGVLPDGTAIGLGMSEAVTMLVSSTAASRAVVLLTDGQQNESSISPEDAAVLASTQNIKIYTIGVVESDSVQGLIGVDEELLRHIADETGGRYFTAQTQEELAEIYDEIGQLEKSRVGRERYEEFTELIGWFVLPAALLLAIDLLLRATWLRRSP